MVINAWERIVIIAYYKEETIQTLHESQVLNRDIVCQTVNAEV